mmetsp:Transcript_31042/g.50440  ORF Transcript_31042/g.50440 Transcript_31042/m.50440 type:complete len:363 (+) Transcript_31042:71-1159(+)
MMMAKQWRCECSPITTLTLSCAIVAAGGLFASSNWGRTQQQNGGMLATGATTSSFMRTNLGTTTRNTICCLRTRGGRDRQTQSRVAAKAAVSNFFRGTKGGHYSPVSSSRVRSTSPFYSPRSSVIVGLAAGGGFGSPPTLRYFNAKGAAEIIRYLFAISGTDYEDYRYPVQMEGVFGQPGFKAVKKEFDADQASGKMPFGKVPIFETEGITIAQSKAIERYVAKKVGLFGENELEGLRIDMICEQIRDIRDMWSRAKGNKMRPDMENEDIVKTVNLFFDEQLPKQMEMLEKLIDSSGFFVGDKVSLADISFYHFLNATFFGPFDQKISPILEKYPKLATLKSKVANIAEVKTWEETRPKTDF